MSLLRAIGRVLVFDEQSLAQRFVLTADAAQAGDDHADHRVMADQSASSGGSAQVDSVSPHLSEARAQLRQRFLLPDNKDIVVRDFVINRAEGWPAMAVFVDGMADKIVINTHILQPLMFLSSTGRDSSTPARSTPARPTSARSTPARSTPARSTPAQSITHDSRRLDVVLDVLLPGNQISVESHWDAVAAGILSGSTAVFVDQCSDVLLIETKGWEHRTVGLAQSEKVVRGPQDAFTESFRVNTALIRSRLRSDHLVTEMLTVGKVATTDVAVLWVDGITNRQLVAEVKRRIAAVDIDYLADSGLLEQFIEDNPRLWVPQVLATERPDRIAAMLMEGHVAIVVGGSPYVIAAPVVFWTLVHSPEDAYLRVPFGSFLSGLRWLSLAVAVLLPAVFIAVTNYHPEMIPTELLLAIAGSREQVPFPVIEEVLLMEFAIELIREAGTRIPSVIGPTIGIVGALIIGQAAVQAGVVSPLLVIVIATTALASFVVPNYNLSFAVRLARFVFLVAAAFFGFYAISLLLCVMIARLSIQQSFGVPLLAPVAPSMDSSPDVLFRGPAYTMNARPGYLFTERKQRQDPVTRPWSADTLPSGWGRPGRRRKRR